MTLNKADAKQNRLGISLQDAMERIASARKRALANEEPCYSEESLMEKVSQLSKRLADFNDITARDDAVFFLSCRQPSLSQHAQIHLMIGLKQRDEWELDKRNRTLRFIKS